MSKLSNFDFLKDFDEKMYRLGLRVEREVNVSPSGVFAESTRFLEYLLKQMLAKIGLEFNSRKDFYNQLEAVRRAGLIDYNYKNKIYSAYLIRNKLHTDIDEIEKNEKYDALQLYKDLFYIAKKYYKDSEAYDRYKGSPQFKPVELDTSDDEIERLEIPEFSQMSDINYDYCVICGEPNHSNYSLCCHKCNRVMDNANNFISIRNSFGKDKVFTKDEVIEFGIPEGYADQLIHSLSKENMLKVTGRDIRFNNMYLDKYLAKIDRYISICELITKFNEDEILPSEIKRTKEYRLGSKKQEPYYQFYKVVDHEIINKFERDILGTENIWESIEYTTITQKQLERWYQIQLGNYKKGNASEPFIVFNRLLQEDYTNLKREGLFEKDIRLKLHVNDEIYNFWIAENPEFIEEINQIKKDLIIKALAEGKTRSEAIEIAGVTAKEYDDLVKFSDFKGDEFSKLRNQEVENRKEKLMEYIKHNDLITACGLAKLSVDDFYMWYEKDIASEFYLNTTRILMHNFLNQRKKGKTKMESAQEIGIEYKYVDHWFKRKLDICEDFKNRHILVVVDLIYDGFKNRKTKKEIAQFADISVNILNSYLKLGQRGYGTYKKIYDYYEAEIIPLQLSRFLNEIKNKPLKKALELSDLSSEELDYCRMEGSKGNPKFKSFYESFYSIKLNTFLNNINKGKSMSKALKNADLTEDELEMFYELGKDGDDRFSEFYQKYYDKKLDIYIKDILNGKSKSQALKNANFKEDELADDMDEIILDKKISIVSMAIRNDLTTKQAAKKAKVSIDDIYDWFLKGRSGDDKFKEFSDLYYENYVSCGSFLVQKALNEDIPLNLILKKSKNIFTREDYDFWFENGFLKEAQEKLDRGEDE